jgi:mycofactocin system glycosyltransferase
VATTPAEGRLFERLIAAGAAHPVPEVGAAPSLEEVSVVVPVRDDPEGLRRLMERVPPEVREVLVVDDGSAPRAAELIERCTAGHGARLLRHPEPRGPGAARNTGAAAAEGSFLAFLDADVDPGGGWLAVLLAHFARPRVAMAAPRVRSEVGPGLLAAYEARRSPLDLGPASARVAAGTKVSYVPSAALVASRQVLDQLGAFDAELRHGEDVDLVWRAVALGHEVRYEPSAVVLHRPRPSWRSWFRQRLGYGSSAAPLDLRHPGEVAPAVMSPWSLALWAMVVAGHRVGAVAVGGFTLMALQRRLPEVPRGEVVRLVALGHLGAGRQLARAVVRAWWPLAVPASLVSRRVRRGVAAAVVVHLATTSGPWWCRAVAVVDDLAYGAGLWRGAWRCRDPRVLLPRLRGWP